jgi:hypothetical protein
MYLNVYQHMVTARVLDPERFFADPDPDPTRIFSNILDVNLSVLGCSLWCDISFFGEYLKIEHFC